MGTDDVEYKVNAKGQLVAATGLKTFIALNVGNDGEALIANSGTASGLSWSGEPISGTISMSHGFTLMFGR